MSFLRYCSLVMPSGGVYIGMSVLSFIGLNPFSGSRSNTGSSILSATTRVLDKALGMSQKSSSISSAVLK